jgi:hypothetical protein
MASDRSRLAFALVMGALIGACFDPLYADGDALAQQWVVCCPTGMVATCQCNDPATCAPEVFACPGQNRCSVSPSCTQGSGGGSATGGGSGFGGGTATGGGAGGGGQIEDAGLPGDGGSALDAGTTQDAGTPRDAGTPMDAGGLPDTWEFCCVAGHLGSCVCPMGQCSAPPYTPCANATCVAGSTTAQCQ